jgi:hypothetical protein
MAFTRVNPGGFSIGAQLTSSQMNNLDADHANALDKTVAGDQLAGVVTMASTAALKVNTAGAQILTSVSAGIKATAANGIEIAAAGALQLDGSSTPYFPTFLSSIGRTIVSPGDAGFMIASAIQTQGIVPAAFSATTAANVDPIHGGMSPAVVNGGSAQVWSYFVPLRQLHNGATLATADLYMIGASAHSALPQTMPAFGLFRASVTTAGAAAVSLNSGAQFIADTSTPVANYKVSHHWTFTCNQNNVIDTTQYAYFAIIWDEGGTNSQAGNIYSGLALGYTTIADMRFA